MIKIALDRAREKRMSISDFYLLRTPLTRLPLALPAAGSRSLLLSRCSQIAYLYLHLHAFICESRMAAFLHWRRTTRRPKRNSVQAVVIAFRVYFIFMCDFLVVAAMCTAYSIRQHHRNGKTQATSLSNKPRRRTLAARTYAHTHTPSRTHENAYIKVNCDTFSI